MKKNTFSKIKKYSALAAGSLSAGVAGAAIDYTDIPDEILIGSDTYEIDLDGDGTMDFRFEKRVNTSGTSFTYDAVGIQNIAGSNAAMNSGGFGLSYGANINSSASFQTLGTNPFYNLGYQIYGSNNGITNQGDQYIGLRFDISGNTHYGWVRINHTAFSDLTIKDFAYEQCSDQPITAGATAGGAACGVLGEECTNPIAINPCSPGNITGSTIGGTPQTFGFCGTSAGSGGANWYSFTGDGGTWTFETITPGAGGQYDTKLWAFSGSCGTLVCEGGNDDGGVGTLSLLSVPTVQGEIYYIVVGGFSANEGNYEMTVDRPAGSFSGVIADVNVCENDPVEFISDFSGGAGNTQWQYSTDGGLTWNNTVLGLGSDTLSLAGASAGDDGLYIRNTSYVCGVISDSTNAFFYGVGTETTSNFSASACGSYTSPSGQVWTSSNTYMDTILNARGCDSVMTINLTINGPEMGTDVITACGSYTWKDGVTYTSNNTTATYTEPGVASNGCDSIYTLDLTINGPEMGTDVITACGSYTWKDGITYTSNNTTATYTEPGVATNGCDSIYTLNLTINGPETGTDVVSSCGSYTWRDGITYTSNNTTATYTEPGVATNGCDSLYTLNLTITPGPSSTDVISSCESYTWRDGIIYTSSNNVATHVVPGAGAGGCDSIYNLDLTILSPETTTEIISACDSYIWRDGVTYTASNNIATHTVAGAGLNGCDSIYTLNLSLSNSETSTQTVVTCAASYTWAADGNTYSADGMYTANLMNTAGCDSTVTLDLTFDSFAQAGIDVDGCDSVMIFGNTYYTNTTVSDTIIGGSAQGCDSITIANVVVNSSEVTNQSVTTCVSYTWPANGMTYTTNGNHSVTLMNANGCDSVVNLDLTIGSFALGTVTITGCDDATVFGNTFTSDTIVYDTIVAGAAQGCDTITEANVVVNQTTSSTITESIDFGTSYNLNGTSYNTTGTYTSIVTNSQGCDSTITLNLTVLSGIGELSTNFKLYPNPTRGTIVLESDEILSRIRLIDTKGSLLMDKKLTSLKENINLSNLDAGIYFYELIDKDGNTSRGKIVREK